MLWHATFCVNSLAHVFGRRVYETSDTSRNSVIVALITSGEGWHNNHHRYPWAARQGFRWWQIDVTYYVLRLFSFVGIVRDIRPVPAAVRDEARSCVGRVAAGAPVNSYARRLVFSGMTRHKLATLVVGRGRYRRARRRAGAAASRRRPATRRATTPATAGPATSAGGGGGNGY